MLLLTHPFGAQRPRAGRGHRGISGRPCGDLFDPIRQERGKLDRERIARETGGVAFDTEKDEPTAIFGRIEADLRSQYVLGYTPTKTNGKHGFRKIKIKVTGPGRTVRAQERDYAD